MDLSYAEYSQLVDHYTVSKAAITSALRGINGVLNKIPIPENPFTIIELKACVKVIDEILLALCDECIRGDRVTIPASVVDDLLDGCHETATAGQAFVSAVIKSMVTIGMDGRPLQSDLDCFMRSLQGMQFMLEPKHYIN